MKGNHDTYTLRNEFIRSIWHSTRWGGCGVLVHWLYIVRVNIFGCNVMPIPCRVSARHANHRPPRLRSKKGRTEHLLTCAITHFSALPGRWWEVEGSVHVTKTQTMAGWFVINLVSNKQSWADIAHRGKHSLGCWCRIGLSDFLKVRQMVGVLNLFNIFNLVNFNPTSLAQASDLLR